MKESDLARKLRSCPLFAQVGDTELSALGRHLRRRRFRRDEVIFHQGDPGDCLHIVATGSVKLILPSEEGEEAIVATLREGDYFGELALLDDGPRSTSVVAVEPTETVTLPRDVFRTLLDEDRDLREAFHAGIAHALRRTTYLVEELHFLDLAGRLAARLVRLAHEADPGAERVELEWPYSQRELAAMIGGARQSVNRVLGELAAEGLILIEGERLTIPDVAALDQASRR
jgi:CRP/FNR family transcriptional regulator, cyclic AMP receptor protein